MNTDRKIVPISCEAINGIFVIQDMRYNPPKNIGLIKPKPFDRGYHYCPSVKMRLHFSCLRKEIPRKWRTADRAWEWTLKYASHFKPKKYSIFNPMIKWVAYMPQLFYLVRDYQLQLIFIKVVIGALFVLYMNNTESVSMDILGAVLITIIGLTVITDLVLFIHKWRSRT